MLIKTLWGRPSSSHITNKTSVVQRNFITHLSTVCSRKWQSGGLNPGSLLSFKNYVLYSSLTWLYSPGFYWGYFRPYFLLSCWWCCQIQICHSGICSLLLTLLLRSLWSSSLLLPASSCTEERCSSFHLERWKTDLQSVGVSKHKHPDV